MSSNDNPLEVELKLLFPAGARAALEAHPALLACAGEPEEHHLHATYYDTPDFDLARNRCALRVRSDGRKRVQTLKTAGDGGVADRRGEWEWPVEGDTPDLALLAQTPVRDLLGADGAVRLEPIFTTEVRRIVRVLRLDGGTVLEAAIDDGRVSSGTRQETIRELELELKDGPLAPVYGFALELLADLPLRIGVETKAARGYRLYTGRPPAPEKSRIPRLADGISGADAFRRIAAAATGGLLANLPATVAGDDEGIHQMRVAIRRLRAALVLFQPHLQAHANERFNEELRRLGQVLGEARDWDVFCLETLTGALDGGVGESWQQVLGPAAQAERETAHDRLALALARPDLTALALAMASWMEGPAEHLGDPALGRKLAELAPELLDRIGRKAFRRGRDISDLGEEDLHALRKSLKKLRYGIDYLAGLYDQNAVRAYLKQLEELQDLLGIVNDCAVAVTLVDRLGKPGHPERIPGIAAVAAWADARRKAALVGLPAAWENFHDTPPFWRS